MNANELFWLAVNAYHEARGESDAGVVAVCKVVLNRAEKKATTIEKIVLAPMQFSWANRGARPAIKDYAAFARCLKLAMRAASEHAEGDDFSGADHYHATSIKPSWAENMRVIDQIGSHIFYRS